LRAPPDARLKLCQVGDQLEAGPALHLHAFHVVRVSGVEIDTLRVQPRGRFHHIKHTVTQLG
jgi:hypothetical protein